MSDTLTITAGSPLARTAAKWWGDLFRSWSIVDEELIVKFEDTLAAKVAWDDRNHYWCEFSTDGQTLQQVMRDAGMSSLAAQLLPTYASMTVYPKDSRIAVRTERTGSHSTIEVEIPID